MAFFFWSLLLLGVFSPDMSANLVDRKGGDRHLSCDISVACLYRPRSAEPECLDTVWIWTRSYFCLRTAHTRSDALCRVRCDCPPPPLLLLIFGAKDGHCSPPVKCENTDCTASRSPPTFHWSPCLLISLAPKIFAGSVKGRQFNSASGQVMV